MTFNIHHGKGMDHKADLYRIAEVIEKSDADMIGLNEVDQVIKAEVIAKTANASDHLPLKATLFY